MELRVVVGADPGRDLALTVPADATIGDLARLAGLAGDRDHLWIDDRQVPATLPVEAANIADGCTLADEPTPRIVTHPLDGPSAVERCPADDPSPVVVVAAGPGSGRARTLAPGRPVRVGRAADNDLVASSDTVSAHHLHVTVVEADGATTDGQAVRGEVELVDLGSHNGTWVGGAALAPRRPEVHALPVTVRVGATVLQVRSTPGCDVPRGHDLAPVDGARPVHRPPRPAPPGPVEPVTRPADPEDRRSTPALRLAGILAPLALGGAMVAMTGSLRFALFALLSPVMMIGNWWSSRRSHRLAGRRAARTRAEDLERFRRDLATARVAERERREALAVDLGEIVHRATEPSRRLWERRPDHDDAWVLRWGSADTPWTPLLDPPDAPPSGPDQDAAAASGTRSDRDDPVDDEVDEAEAEPTAVLHDLPVLLDLGRHRVVGVTGDAAARTAVARSLVLQAGVLHGPGDLAVDVVARSAGDWDWTKWLPHRSTRDGSPTALAPHRLVVVDDPRVVTGPDPALRHRLADADTMAIVLADHPDQLPAACSAILDLDATGTGTLVTDDEPRLPGVLSCRATEADARRVARGLGRCRDPEQATATTGLPHTIPLADLELERAPVPGHPDGLATPIGIGHDGPAEVDLVAHGPHALVAGTTGSGKSELLRALVAGLARSHSPDEVVFVLVDYKGGSAFRACARLPHTVGLVTDLDDHLGERALVSLRAELHHRERRLAAADAEDLVAHRAAGSPGGPIPRLVVVIDEFATLAAELPEFLDALVAIAQRGRSLGLHLVLATQRPRGCVDADIRANTNLRIALRVQDEADARDVIDDPRPAMLDREQPGRAWIRRGHDELREVQVALASAPPVRHAGGRARPFLAHGPTRRVDAGDQDQLERLVADCRATFEASGRPAPRRPWLDMLPPRLALSQVVDRAGDTSPGVAFGLADRPDQQAQPPACWSPGDGHVAVFGRRGSGTTTTLATLVTGLVTSHRPDRLHVQVVDGGTGDWKDATRLDHVGSVVDGRDHDDVDGLLGWVTAEIDRRRRSPGGDPPPGLVLVVDGLDVLVAGDDPRRSTDLVTRLGTALDDGPAVGLTVLATATRVSDLPTRLRSSFARRLVLDVDDRDLALLGLDRRVLPRSIPGRAVDAATGTVIQVAESPSWPELAERVAAVEVPRNPPHRVRGLPDRVQVDELAPPTDPGAGAGSGELVVPLGIGRDAQPAVLRLHAGDHAVIAGPARSGRTSLLQVLSSQVRRARPTVRQVGVCPEGRSALHGWSSLDACGSAAGMQQVLTAAGTDDHDWLVLVDDIRRWTDDPVLAELAQARTDRVTLVVAGRPDDLRGTFGGWLRAARSSRTGILLQPELAVDGDLLGARLPRRLSTPLGPGRGFVVNGGAPLIAQFARPPEVVPPGGLAA